MQGGGAVRISKAALDEDNIEIHPVNAEKERAFAKESPLL